MNTRPLRWWPDAALDMAAAVIAPAWRAWCADWDVPAAAVVACNSCDSTPPAGDDWHWHEAANQGSMRVWLGLARSDGADAIRELLFASGPPLLRQRAGNPTPIACEVAAVGWRELRERLSPSLTAAGMSAVFSDCEAKADTAPSEDDWQRWSGAVDVTLGTPSHAKPILIHLCAAAAEALLANRPAAPEGTASARQPITMASTAINRQVVHLAAELDGVSLGLDVFQSLRLGDVLPLQHRLEEPLHVRLRGDGTDAASAPVFCAGLLGARRDRRAVELIRASAPA